jgi:ParB family chromosome partitioning protein
MAEKRPALGRGLGALIPSTPVAPRPAASAPPAPAPDRPGAAPHELDIDLLTPNPHQPRQFIEEAGLEELAQSIRSNGVIQPILVRRVGTRFEIVAGERRWRAAQRAGLLKIPVVVRDVDDAHLLQVALIENIQRENLNPIEEAHAYRRLGEELHLSQEAIATAVGKDRATIANYTRLLRLPAEVKNSQALSMGHARALLALPDEAAQRRIARDVIARALSVRDTEALVRRETSPPPETPPVQADPNTRAAEEQLRLALNRLHVGRRTPAAVRAADRNPLTA